MNAALWSVLAALVVATASTQPQSNYLRTAQPMMSHGMMGHGMMGHGMMGRGVMGSMARHHQAMTYGIPEPYRSMRDPLSDDDVTLHRGAKIYAQTCAACHGRSGLGDGPAGQTLNPPPANLRWLSHSHMMTGASDGYIYWAVAEGGQRFGTAMPPFKGALSRYDIWSVVTYLRHGMRASRR